MVKILLGRDDIKPAKPDKDGRKQLYSYWAAWYGDKAVIKILLGQDDINLAKPSQTQLRDASLNGHYEVAQILPEQDDVKPEKSGGDGQILLCCAALSHTYSIAGFGYGMALA